MGDAEDPSTAPLVLAHPFARMFHEPSSGSRPERAEPTRARSRLTGFRALTFHTLLSFQGASSGCSPRLPCGSRSGPVAGAAVTLSRAFQVRQPSGLSPQGMTPGAPTVSLSRFPRSGVRSAGPERGRHRPNGGSSPQVFPGSQPSTLPASRLNPPPWAARQRDRVQR